MPQTITATIAFVSDTPRDYQSPNGLVKYIEGEFKDGSQFSSGARPEFADKRLADLRALEGKEGQYEVESKPDYKGKKQYKLLSWPGRPVAAGMANRGSSRAGGGSYVPRFRDTPEGFASEQDSIHRSVALTQAVAHKGAGATGNDVLTAASMFLDFLRKGEQTRTFPKAGEPTQEAQPAQETPPPQSNKPNCPSCGKPDAVFRSKKEGEGWYCWRQKGGCGHNWKDGERPLSRSVLEDALDRLDKMSKVMDIVSCSAWLWDERQKKVLEGLELYKLDRYSVERAISVCRNEDDFDVAAGFIRQLRDAKRLQEADVPQWENKLQVKRSQVLSLQEMERRF